MKKWVDKEISQMEWKFADSPNTAVFTTHEVVRVGQWIAHVFHDEDDGAWQFHDDGTNSREKGDALLVGLSEIVQLDPSVVMLADLPLGWRAWRVTKDSPWQRSKI